MRKFDIHKKTVMTRKIQTMMSMMHAKAHQESEKNTKTKKFKALRIYPKGENLMD
tara:strand:+ start:404 stop:568 length:165 start_codon:yes stop_codon:yes gene_type:complete